MFLEIITPDRTIYSGEVTAVKFPGSQGSFEVLNNHAALISNLDAGQIRVKDSEGTHFFDVQGGVVEVLDNKITVLA